MRHSRYFFNFLSLASRLGRSSIIFVRVLFFNFFHCRHSSLVRKQALHSPVLPSNSQILMHGDSTVITNPLRMRVISIA
jgi:hypothetical protein